MSSIRKKRSLGNTLFKKRMIILGMLPGLLLYIVFCVVPSLGTFLFSFTDISNIPGQPIHFVGLSNYEEIPFDLHIDRYQWEDGIPTPKRFSN